MGRAVLGIVNTTFGMPQEGAPTGTLVSRVDRTQAAQLYAGNAEYGYFVRGMAARARAAGMGGGADSGGLLEFAATLSRDEMQCASLRL